MAGSQELIQQIMQLAGVMHQRRQVELAERTGQAQMLESFVNTISNAPDPTNLPGIAEFYAARGAGDTEDLRSMAEELARQAERERDRLWGEGYRDLTPEERRESGRYGAFVQATGGAPSGVMRDRWLEGAQGFLPTDQPTLGMMGRGMGFQLTTGQAPDAAVLSDTGGRLFQQHPDLAQAAVMIGRGLQLDAYQIEQIKMHQAQAALALRTAQTEGERASATQYLTSVEALLRLMELGVNNRGDLDDSGVGFLENFLQSQVFNMRRLGVSSGMLPPSQPEGNVFRGPPLINLP